MPLENFHPAVAAWFSRNFPEPTAASAGRLAGNPGRPPHTDRRSDRLGQDPGGFSCGDRRLVREAISGSLADAVQVVYVSPLKALSNDIRRNLEAPLSGIAEELQRQGIEAPEVRAQVRTGDTPAERTRGDAQVPAAHSGHDSGVLVPVADQRFWARDAFEHPLRDRRRNPRRGSTKRGSHLALSLERLGSLAGRRLQRIGLSATQKPIEEIARLPHRASRSGR